MHYLKPDPDLYGVPPRTDAYQGMPYRRLGRSGLQVSAIGLGTWKFGYPETGDQSRVGEATALSILDRALEVGCTFWDTANRYNFASGNAERIIGTWLEANPDQRRNIVLATKICGGMDGVTPNHSGLSRTNILDATYACLERLRTDHIDLLYFHQYRDEAPAEESLAAVEDLVRQDLVRHLAVSNFTCDQLRLYQAVEQSLSIRCRVLAVQNRFDPLRGENPHQAGVLDYCAGHGISFVPYSPLAKGLLTDRYLDPGQVGEGDRLVDEGSLKKLADEQVMERLKRLAELAESWGHSISQLTLAYILTLPGMGPPIPSASTVEQLESNAAAGKIELSSEQQMALAEVFSQS